MNDNGNFFIAIGLSIAILVGWHWLYEVPHQKAAQVHAQVEKAASQGPLIGSFQPPKPRQEVIAEVPRVPFENGNIRGSINLRTGRVDDLTLLNYRETIDPKSAPIIFLSPGHSAEPYQGFYAEFGWLSSDGTAKLPARDTFWKTQDQKLSPGHDVHLTWDNGSGLTFERVISLDENYLFTVTDRIHNATGQEMTVYPYSLVTRRGTPKTLGYATLHEGPLGVLGDTLRERNYKKLREEPLYSEDSTGGWVGITDVYWLAAVLAPPQDKVNGRFIYGMIGPEERYQADLRKGAVTLKSGDDAESRHYLFAGAKELNVLDHYRKHLPAPMFDRAVDFGWFYFIAKPFFKTIDWLARLIGNYGLAIIVFTIALRLLFFPMSEASFRNMERMKALQPQMERLKERYANDTPKLHEEMQAIYKREKLNPAAGCVPMLVQIPVFFALYKVLLVSIEMRHAPFFGWIKDLSAPDPSNVFNLFGVAPWHAPSFLHLGALPIMMGLTMFIQQKLSPPPGDKTSAQIFMLLPLVFTFLLANMSAGLVIYWTFSNILAIAQQTLIKHRAKGAK
ncbi:MAG TPA: membrane protein insertase YidC [Alphaproteobacteria bacterium]|nr:membrane protein insertase YidC [Alphaproteobacteria bacterium]